MAIRPMNGGEGGVRLHMLKSGGKEILLRKKKQTSEGNRKKRNYLRTLAGRGGWFGSREWKRVFRFFRGTLHIHLRQNLGGKRDFKRNYRKKLRKKKNSHY